MISKIVFYDLSLENLGVQILKSILNRNGFNAKVIYEPTYSDAFIRRPNYSDRLEKGIKEILSLDPDVVAFSVYTFNIAYYLQVAGRLKNLNPNIITLFGGSHATLVKEKLLANPSVDFSIIGEGEAAIVELLEELNGQKRFHQVRNLCYRKNGLVFSNPVRPYIHDLDNLPFPDKSDYFSKNSLCYTRYLISASRGCPFKCTFCSNEPLHEIYHEERKHLRARSPANVIEELVAVTRAYPVKCIHFIDELFTARPSWLQEFAKLYKKEINLPLECDTHPLLLNNRSLDLLKDINTKVISVGVQTGSDDMRQTLLKRKESNVQIASMIQAAKEREIKIGIDHIFGLPGETFDHIKESIDRYADWGPTYVNINWLQYLPGTKIIDSAIECGNIKEQDRQKIDDGLFFFEDYQLLPEHRIIYGKYINLMQCIGVLPGNVVHFLNNHIEWIPHHHIAGRIVQVISRVFLNRKNWAMRYLLIAVHEKMKNFTAKYKMIMTDR